MGTMASQITSLTIVNSTVYSGADQRKHQGSASLAFVRGIHRWPVNFPHKWPVTRQIFPFDDVTINDVDGVALMEAAEPLPWASVHWLDQCTLDCHWLTQCTLGYHWATQRILAGYTGTPLEMPLEKLSWICPTLGCHWRNSHFCSLHWNTTGGTVTAHPRPDTYSSACRVASMPVWNDKMAGHQ